MCYPYLCFPKVLGRGKFSDITSCCTWYPCALHPLLQLLLEVGIQGVCVPQRALGSMDTIWPHLPPFSPSSVMLGFSSEARAVAMGCIEMFWLEVKAVLLCRCMRANWLHQFVSTLFCSWLEERMARSFSCYCSCALPAWRAQKRPQRLLM